MFTADLSVADVTVRAITIIAIAFVVLLLIGWRKTARVEPKSPRAAANDAVRQLVSQPRAVDVEHVDAPEHRRAGVAGRLVALTATTGVAVLTGVILAILIAFAAGGSVIWLTRLLGQ